MDQHILRLNEFFVEGGKQNLSHVLLHITEPSTPEETLKGYFFALCEVNNGTSTLITKLQEMIDRAENEYYEVSEDQGKNAFELVLEKMNSESYIFEKEQGTLNCIVGAIRQKEIIFSYYGNPHLLLFYKNKTGAYERMDLIKNNGGDDTEQNSQLFSQIIQGKLSPSDYLFAGTPHIIDFFSHDRLEKIVTTRSAQQSAQHLEKVLGDLRNGYSFGGMIIHLFKPEISEGPKKPKVVQGSSSQSLQNLFHREQATANTLSPSLLPKLDKIKGILGNQTPNPLPSPARPEIQNAEINAAHLSQHRPTRREPERNLGDHMASFGNMAWKILKGIGRFFLHLFYFLYTFIYNIFRFIILLGMVIVNYKHRRTTILENWKQAWRSHKQNFYHLPATTKFMLVASILLALGFVGSLVYIRHRQAVQAKEAAFNQSIQELVNHKNSINGAFAYKNDELAYTEYQKSEELLPKLKCETKEQKSICANLTNEFNALAVRLRKINMVSTTPVTNFSGFATSETAGLIRVKNKLFAYSAETSTLYSYDLLSGETKVIPTYPTISGFTEAATPKENDYILFLFNKKQLMRLDPADSSVKLVDISFPGDLVNLAGFIIYNRRLYSLDTQAGTVFRHDSTRAGFGQGQDWLKDKTVSLANASDLTIDGDLFVSKSSGEIVKFTSGVMQQFTLSGLEPALSTATKLWTYTDIPYLYILEPSQKRLVIFEKNGHLIGQFTGSSFNKPTGFSIDYTTKTAYIVDSGKLLKFTLPN